jgi:hypothetical protein
MIPWVEDLIDLRKKPNLVHVYMYMYIVLKCFVCYTVLRPAEEIFHLQGNVPIAGEGLQNLGLCSALMAFEQ